MTLFWDKKIEYLKLPPITVAEIETFENERGIQLPLGYKALILEQNGGGILNNAHPSPVPTNWATDHIAFGNMMGIGDDYSMAQSDYFIQEWEMPEGLLLLSGTGHEWVALDYRETTDNPPVIFIDNEAEQIVELALDFNMFLAGLYKATYE